MRFPPMPRPADCDTFERVTCIIASRSLVNLEWSGMRGDRGTVSFLPRVCGDVGRPTPLRRSAAAAPERLDQSIPGRRALTSLRSSPETGSVHSWSTHASWPPQRLREAESAQSWSTHACWPPQPFRGRVHPVLVDARLVASAALQRLDPSIRGRRTHGSNAGGCPDIFVALSSEMFLASPNARSN